MKKVFLGVLFLTMLFMFSGCCLSHEWVEADCTKPKTCSKCEKTEGEPSGHQWKEANCIDPKTCALCGLTEGSKLAHDLGDEEIQAPDYVNATATFVRTCIYCGHQVARKGDLDKLHDGDTFLMTPEEFSDRFTKMQMAMQYLMDDQYVSYIEQDTKSGSLKIYMCQSVNGNNKIVGEFVMKDSHDDPLLQEQKTEAGIIQGIQGKVSGVEPVQLAMYSLLRTVDPTIDSIAEVQSYTAVLMKSKFPGTSMYMLKVGDIHFVLEMIGRNVCEVSVEII